MIAIVMSFEYTHKSLRVTHKTDKVMFTYLTAFLITTIKSTKNSHYKSIFLHSKCFQTLNYLNDHQAISNY